MGVGDTGTGVSVSLAGRNADSTGKQTCLATLRYNGKVANYAGTTVSSDLGQKFVRPSERHRLDVWSGIQTSQSISRHLTRRRAEVLLKVFPELSANTGNRTVHPLHACVKVLSANTVRETAWFVYSLHLCVNFKTAQTTEAPRNQSIHVVNPSGHGIGECGAHPSPSTSPTAVSRTLAGSPVEPRRQVVVCAEVVVTDGGDPGHTMTGTRPVPGQSPVLTRAACGRVPTGSYSLAGQLSGPWRVPAGIPTGSSRVFEQAGACSAARRVPGSEVTASLRRISPNGARSVFNSELKSIRRPRGAKNRPAAVGKSAGLRPGTRPVPGQSPVLTRAACGRVPPGSYSSAGQLSGPWRVPGGIPTGSSRVFEQYTSSKEYTEVGDAAFSATCKQLTSPSEIEIGDNLPVGLLALVAEEERQAELAGACSAARRVPGSEVTASLRRISPNGARSVFNSELKSIRRPRGAKNRPAAVGKPAGLRPECFRVKLAGHQSPVSAPAVCGDISARSSAGRVTSSSAVCGVTSSGKSEEIRTKGGRNHRAGHSPDAVKIQSTDTGHMGRSRRARNLDLASNRLRQAAGKSRNLPNRETTCGVGPLEIASQSLVEAPSKCKDPSLYQASEAANGPGRVGSTFSTVEIPVSLRWSVYQARLASPQTIPVCVTCKWRTNPQSTHLPPQSSSIPVDIKEAPPPCGYHCPSPDGRWVDVASGRPDLRVIKNVGWVDKDVSDSVPSETEVGPANEMILFVQKASALVSA
ncbi:hypothetical protein Bbelb_134870 [Branchiostoma belcheri]|nr:hypothetical protein Bbelb_134870 [Branchiostoma belcheri]